MRSLWTIISRSITNLTKYQDFTGPNCTIISLNIMNLTEYQKFCEIILHFLVIGLAQYKINETRVKLISLSFITIHNACVFTDKNR
jgi:hypothetical protein